ncbi:MAG: hypothetical protein JRH20_11435 [Deltaproteobacteria bacterium]|nr:hypothetical protein [Deltaproteobacteria bacterium]
MIPPLFWLNLTTLTLIFGGLALYALGLHVLERRVSRYVAHRLGWRGVLITGWLGVPLHELSHILMAKLFGHRIIAYRLFEPDPVSGTLGYVRHSYRHPTLWQRSGYFFIGIAPLLAGSALLLSLLAWMAGGFSPLLNVLQPWSTVSSVEQLWQQLPLLGWNAQKLFELIWQRSEPALLMAQLYLGICVAAHMAPSRADLGTALSGVLSLVGLLLAGGALGAIFGVSCAGTTQTLTLLPLFLLLVGIWQLALVATLALFERLRHGPRRATGRS